MPFVHPEKEKETTTGPNAQGHGLDKGHGCIVVFARQGKTQRQGHGQTDKEDDQAHNLEDK
jgi:hypothetical protein